MYKVLKRLPDGRLVSAWLGQLITAPSTEDWRKVQLEALALEYKPGEWTYPKVGRILVFNDWARAMDWAGDHITHWEVHEVECLDPRLCQGLLRIWDATRWDFFEKVQQSWERYICDQRAPYGTYECLGVKLIKDMGCEV